MINRELITYYNPKSPVSEMFKTLRTNIQFMNTNKQLKTLLVSSTLPGEGKSWTAANLAVTFAQAGKSVLVVDADMRKGRQFNIFGVSPTPGLSNYLSGISDDSDDVTLDDVIQDTDIENLYVLAAGNVPPNPSELLISEKMLDLYDIVKRNFDITIFDGTPSLIVTDAPILARIVDSTILVTAHNETKIDDVTKVKKSIENIGGKVAGVVVNKIPLSAKKYENTYYYGSTMPAVVKDKKKKRHDFDFEEPKAFRQKKKKEKRKKERELEEEWNYKEDDNNKTFATDTIDTTQIINEINKTDTIDTTNITETVNEIEQTNSTNVADEVDANDVVNVVDSVDTVEVNDATDSIDNIEASIEEKIKENWNKIEQEFSVENNENNNENNITETINENEPTKTWQENNDENNNEDHVEENNWNNNTVEVNEWNNENNNEESKQWEPVTDFNNKSEETVAAEPILSWENDTKVETETNTNNENVYKSFNDIVINNDDTDDGNDNLGYLTHPDPNDSVYTPVDDSNIGNIGNDENNGPLSTQDVIDQINKYLEQERSKLKNGDTNG